MNVVGDMNDDASSKGCGESDLFSRENNMRKILKLDLATIGVTRAHNKFFF